MTRPIGYPTSPALFWDHFYNVTQIPRNAKKEKAFREHLINLAKKNNLKYKTDKKGNLVVYVPATPGHENKETIILQSHMDMVCTKTPDKQIDFDKDPIQMIVKDGFIYADRTSLGADNGVGCACAMALMEDKNSKHPALELLFTVEEEIGLFGALNLDSKMLSGKRMLNLDTEEFGFIFIGCAGGKDYELSKSYKMIQGKKNLSALQIEVTGLMGGHSGIDIHRGRGNAICILVATLKSLGVKFDLAEFSGGVAHNVIPRSAIATILTEKKNLKKITKKIEELKNNFLSFLPQDDAGINFKVTDISNKGLKVLNSKDQEMFLNFLAMFPHGAHGYDWKSKDPLPTISNNLAIVDLKNGKCHFKTSLRFFDAKELVHLEHAIDALVTTAGFSIKKGKGYPNWKPNYESKFLESVKNVYSRHASHIDIKAVHAGLECGVLIDKLGGDLEAVSIGPNMSDVHSPTERLEIESVAKFWDMLIDLLANA